MIVLLGRTTFAVTTQHNIFGGNKTATAKFTVAAPLVCRAVYAASGEAGTTSICRTAIYADAGGVPGAKVAETASVTMTPDKKFGTVNDRRVFIRFDFAGDVALAPGDYWIAVQSQGSMFWGRNNVAGPSGTSHQNADGISDGMTDPFGAATAGTVDLLAYVVAGDGLAFAAATAYSLLEVAPPKLLTAKAVAYSLLKPGATIDTVTPVVGSPLGGTAVTIDGEGFTGVTGVNIGGTPATNVVVVSDTQITCTAPAHAIGLVDVEVVKPGATEKAEDAFTYAWTLTCTPNHGTALGGTRVTITRS